MAKENVIKLYQETYENITSSSEQWKRFLDTASNIYRYNFAAQIMIYAQRPDATACAEYEVWSDEMRRKIKYGSKKIAIYDDVTGEQTYLYDISDTRQTKESRPMFNWNLDYFHQKAVLQRLSTTLELDIDGKMGFADNVVNMIQQYVREQYQELDDDYEREGQSLGENEEEAEREREKQILIASSSAAYAVMKRCGMSQRLLDEKFNFNGISEINKEQMLALGDLSSNAAEDFLKEVRNAVKTYDKEHFHEEIKKLEDFIEENREKLLSYDTKIMRSSGYGHREKEELAAVSININDRSHDYALVLKNDGVFVVKIKDTRGLNYHDYERIFDENAVLSYNAELIPFSEISTDVKYDFIMHSGQYKECISKLKYELAERVKENERSENAVQNGQPGDAGTSAGRGGENNRGSNPLRNDETFVYERAQKDTAWSAQTSDVSERTPVRDTKPGGDAYGTDDGKNDAAGERDRETERRESASLGSEDEQHSAEGRGNGSFAIDRKLEQPIPDTEPTVTIIRSEQDFDTELAAYKEHVKEEIAQEAAAAGMTVEEYAANGYELKLPNPSFTIYQLKDNVPVDYHFRSLERLQRNGLAIDPANYEEIYTAPLTPGMSLERIFEKFNFDRPDDFKGHSLSVSDVVVLHQNGRDTAHYTDSIGFVDISKDFLLENPLKAAELSTEQNANMIDGVINNTPNTDALEAQAAAGEQISLADLADAIQKDREAAEPDTARITAAAKSRYDGMVALFTMDDKIYIGKSENYDNKGHYDNKDNSLLYVSDCQAAFTFLSSEGCIYPQDEALNRGIYTREDYEEFSRITDFLAQVGFTPEKEFFFADKPFSLQADTPEQAAPETKTIYYTI